MLNNSFQHLSPSRYFINITAIEFFYLRCCLLRIQFSLCTLRGSIVINETRSFPAFLFISVSSLRNVLNYSIIMIDGFVSIRAARQVDFQTIG